MLKKCPELVEDFIERVVVLLVERSHGVVLCGVQVQREGGGAMVCQPGAGVGGGGEEAYLIGAHLSLFCQAKT